jgi:hypothetical protein
MPNDDDMSAVADMSAAHAVDRAMPSFCARLERGALETQADGGFARTSEHPVALVQRAENRLALCRLLPANSIAHTSNAFRSTS